MTGFLVIYDYNAITFSTDKEVIKKLINFERKMKKDYLIY
jgi:hypothetical protein